MSTPRTEIDTLRSRIEQCERDIESEVDRELLLAFSDRLELLREEYSDHRHLKLLRHCTRLAEHAGELDAALTDRDAAEDVVRWIHREYENQETNRDYRVALRVFGRHVADEVGVDTNEAGIPEGVAWVSSKTSRNYDPTPDPADMLDLTEDVKPMIDAAKNPRDAALIAVQFEAGLRGGELYDLTVGDVTDSEYGFRLRVDGKTGQRSVSLVADFSIPRLQRWLSDHPARANGNAPLWSKLSTPEQYSYQRFLQCFVECADRAEITKPVTPTNFRKSNATWLAKHRDANAALIEDRQGRTRGSKAVARYIAQFGEDTEAQYARLQGKEIETNEPDELAPVECPRCGRDAPRDESFCMWCNQALEHGALTELRENEREQRRALLAFAKTNPELLDKLEDVEPLIEAVGGDAEILDAARRFAETTND
ncbi:site-specific integrase [Haladaptatus halobius]|uniref:site-specific integrase n=1 Tax=Haladaptatus halobius TaxID=2884875 RepID=UPI001D0B365C|nr:site-specific integrase [Haladaptatus halobius]